MKPGASYHGTIFPMCHASPRKQLARSAVKSGRRNVREFCQVLDIPIRPRGKVAMAESTLSLAVNGREHQLKGRLVLFEAPGTDPGSGLWDGSGTGTWSAAIVGLGYVGLPTAAALHERCGRIIRDDRWPARLRAERGRGG